MSPSALGVLITAFALAQAEPAPEPAPEPVSPAEPAAAAPTTPPGPTPVVAEPTQDFALGIGLAGARRLGETAASLGPRHGFEVSMQFGHIYARPGGLELAVGGGFAYQRYRATVPIKILEGVSTLQGERTFSFYEFQVHQSVYLPLGQGVGTVRPYVDVGAGLTMAYFSSREPELAPGELRATRPIGSATAGLDVVTGSKGSRAGLAVGVVHMFRAPALEAPGDRRVEVFGNRAMLRLTFLQPF
jgi:hypothetical protein